MSTKYLALDLKAALASFGERARAGRRTTSQAPTKSALLGMMASALGLTREAYGDALPDLRKLLLTTVSFTCDVPLLYDYHIVRYPKKSPKGGSSWSRKRILEEVALDTQQTYRHYLQGQQWCVLFHRKGDGIYTLETLRDALLEPHWPLYLGRKSCPLSVPLNARIFEAPNLQDAVKQTLDTRFPLNRTKLTPHLVRWEEGDYGEVLFKERRLDIPVGTTLSGSHRARNENISEVQQ